MNHPKKTSILNLNWQQKTFDERHATSIYQRFGLSEVLSNLLSAREISLDEIENFLEPKIKTALPNPFELGDMDKAVAHVIEAIRLKKKITIFADYDVDGATSAATLKRFFREVGIEVGIYIPDRVLEGYGPNSQALLNLKKSGTDLVITVDCGTVAFKPLEDAAAVGLDIIVIDHHLGVLEKPQSIAVINPNLLDEKFPHKNLCAAGVSFLFAVAINKKLRELGFYYPPLEGGSKSLATSGRGAAGFQENSTLKIDPASNRFALRSFLKGRISDPSTNYPKAERFYSTQTLQHARELRTNKTDAEYLLWYFLQNKQLDGHKFRRQQPVGNYIVDFACLEKNLIIELDGSQHGTDESIKHDLKRTEFLEKSGFKVLRFWNSEVFENLNDVLDAIFFNLLRPYPPIEGGSESESREKAEPLPDSLRSSTLPQGEGNQPRVREPNLLGLLDLVALGTVCDVMSLTGLNRAFVAAGLKVLKTRKNLGLRAICDLAGLDEEPTAYHLGFVIGPRINAGGRIGKSDLGARLLSSENEEEVKAIAEQLEIFNKQRKDVEVQVLDEAVKALESGAGGFKTTDPIIFAVSKNWHQGVIGIVASRLKDLYNKPVAVIAIDDEGKKGKASCRSISGIDFGGEILKARFANLLIEGGGHAMAGGFSVLPEKISDLHQFFCNNLGEKVAELSLQRTSEFDIALDLPQVNIELLKELAKLEPFGVGNARPKFLLRDVQKIKGNFVGKTGEHVSCIFSTKSALGFSGQIQAIAFRCGNNALGGILLDPKYTKPMSLIGTLNINSWMGVEKVQMIIEDALI